MQGCVCPHPPLLIPQIGGSQLRKVEATAEAMRELADLAGERETAIVLSPHTPVYREAFTIKSAPTLAGDFGAFGQPHARQEHANDVDLVEAIVQAAGEAHLPIVPVNDAELDHGVLVPMHFIRARHLVSISVVAPFGIHRDLGRAVRTAVELTRRDVLFVASGDMSHRLIPGAPAGYDKRGQAFDELVIDRLSEADFAALDQLDKGLVAGAGECGLRSLIALGGFLEGEKEISARVFNYEGPFGVGYLVAGFNLGEAA